MSLMPWGWDLGGGLSPFGYTGENVFNDPWFNRMDLMPSWMGAPTLPSVRRMERELGRLISSVKEDDKSFQMCVDVGQFRPNEITVKTTENSIIVHGKHEERTDQHGYVSREFRRRFTIPKGVNPETVTSTLSPDGVLTVLAPKLNPGESNERVIPITMTQSAGSSNMPSGQSIGQK